MAIPTPLKTPEPAEDCCSDLFARTLAEQRLTLTRGQTRTLQLNLGFLCDLACRHCHLEAGPQRREVMSRATMEDVIAFARRVPFAVIDITGGAPELVPDLPYLLQSLAPLTGKLLLRSNLTAIAEEGRQALLKICVDHQVTIVASFPSLNAGQADAQRGGGVFERSLETLRRLNALGYGQPGSGLELDLVASPAGAFLPAGQAQTEKHFKRQLATKWGIVFNQLYTFANVPLGRFRTWLQLSGNFDSYLESLRAAFNPCTIDGLMCRHQLSVAWDGTLYDCDFNLAAAIPLGSARKHVAQLLQGPEVGAAIATGEHCFACTAGSGFT
ncbi:MAG: arsenosugar biosynthesis radical SAM (seleno)protein ArsS [Trichloromonadaceae bacterium]